MSRDFASPEQLEWEQTVPRAVTSDILWKLDAYRSALFALHLARSATRKIAADPPAAEIAGQMRRSVGSMSTNIAEGYSRATRADRIRFLGFSLGSVRESVVWYLGAADTLGDALVDSRLILLARVRALDLGLIRSLRKKRGSDSDFES